MAAAVQWTPIYIYWCSLYMNKKENEMFMLQTLSEGMEKYVERISSNESIQ